MRSTGLKPTPLSPGDGLPSDPFAGRRARVVRFGLGLAGLLVALLCLIVAGLLIGSRAVPPSEVFGALTRPDLDLASHRVILQLRVPRVILCVVVGAAFGVAGALIQALTRNPLADPGVLGINAGAAFSVVLGVSLFGVTEIAHYLPLAMIGAAAATAAVHLIALRGPGGATPLRLTLVGVAVAAALGGISQALALSDSEVFDRMRFWGAGTVADRPAGTISAVLGFVVVGLVIAMLLARPLNLLALGDNQAQALGARTTGVRSWCILAIALLCGAGTAASGPIGFVGLMVPHAVRWITGPDQRWILPLTLVASPSLLLGADIIGRLVVWPAELQVGIVTAFLGAPMLMILVRSRSAVGAR